MVALRCGLAPEGTPAFRIALAPDGGGLITNTQGERPSTMAFTHVSWESDPHVGVQGVHTDWTTSRTAASSP